MNSKDTRSDAELYRQERKERIKKDAAKTKKGTGKASQWIGKVIAIVLCVAIVGGSFWYLFDFFGWPEKLTTVATVKVDDKDVRVNESKFNFYYMAAYNSAMNTSYQYSQYGLNFGFDYTKPADEQTTKDADGNEITYAEKFKNDAIASLEQTLYYAAKAKEAGVELTDDDISEINETMSSLRTRAESGRVKYSLSAYIIMLYGKGLNANLFEKYIKEQMLANRYLQVLKEDYASECTEEEIQKEYEENSVDYQSLDVRVYGFSIKTEKDDDGNEIAPEYTKEEQLARAQEMISRATDEETFKKLCLEYCTEEEYKDFNEKDASLATGMDYATLKSNMGEESAKWAFSADRQAGDVTTWETDSFIYAVYFMGPAYRSEERYVSVRHLLVKFPDADSDKSDSAEESEPVTHLDDGIAYIGEKHDNNADEKLYVETPKTNDDAKRIAEGYLELYNKGEQTEEYFATLADLYSDDTSSTSAGNGEGGLIANMKKNQYVKPFESWAFDPARKAGDTGIVETEYGYHVMYFVEVQEEPAWKTDVREKVAADKAKAEAEASEQAYTGSLTAKDKAIGKAVNACLDLASSLSFG